MKLNKTLAVAGLLMGMLCVPMFAPPAEAHGVGPRNGKHHYCHDKHGRWRSHPHCPAPQPRYGHHRPHYGHYPPYRYSRYPYQRRPEVIYVRRDNPYDYRSRYGKSTITDRRDQARSDVRDSRDQLRDARAELKKDRAELRRDIRNGASKDEIRAARQEIRADRQEIKDMRQDLRKDRSDLKTARRN
jgi:hypothetical protein